MKNEDFEFYRKLLLEHSGLSLDLEKAYLLTTRLDPLARSLGMQDLSELAEALRNGAPAHVLSAVVQAMTTRETSFFRDMKPFSVLKNEIFPALTGKNTGTKVIRILSAGCSTGQEPYSLAMAAKEFLRNHPEWSARITAIDIAEDALAHAQEGLYAQFDIQRGLSMKLMLEHFTIEDTQWRVQEDLKRMIRFQKLNLLQPMESLGKFDIIFCRNVLIYFDAATKKHVLEQLGGRLDTPGYLFLGACETVIGLETCFKPSTEMPGVQVLK